MQASNSVRATLYVMLRTSMTLASVLTLVPHLIAPHEGCVAMKRVSVDCIGCVSDFYANNFAACSGPV